MTCTDLSRQINTNNNCLCIGLDPELGKIPKHLLGLKDPIFEFNKAIIEATKNECVAYKPNIAFYESLGRKGWESLEKTMEVIPSTHFTIADAKRGDIGNTSKNMQRLSLKPLTLMLSLWHLIWEKIVYVRFWNILKKSPFY